MDIYDLLSNIGGTCGLYVGVSFLTFGEIAEFLLRFMSPVVPKKRRVKKHAGDDDEVVGAPLRVNEEKSIDNL